MNNIAGKIVQNHENTDKRVSMMENKESREEGSLFQFLGESRIKGLVNAESFIKPLKRRDFVELLESLGLNLKDFLEAMGKDKRYFINENSDRLDLDIPETFFFTQILRNLLREELKERVRAYLRDAYERIKCEVIALWVVRVRNHLVTEEEGLERGKYLRLEEIKDCVLLDKTMLKYNFDNTVEFFSYRDDIRTLERESLTSYPLYRVQTLNLFGDEIIQHPGKRFRDHRNADYLRFGRLESLLRVPGYDYDVKSRGTRHFFLLSFENKLSYDTINDVWFMKRPEEGPFEGFTREDVGYAETLRDCLMADLKLYIMMAFHEDLGMGDWKEILEKGKGLAEKVF